MTIKQKTERQCFEPSLSTTEVIEKLGISRRAFLTMLSEKRFPPADFVTGARRKSMWKQSTITSYTEGNRNG